MKKLSILLLLMTTVVFFSCEEEQLISEDSNGIQQDELINQELSIKSQAKQIDSDSNGLNPKNKSYEAMGVEVNGGDLQIYQVDELIVYVDYKEAVNELFNNYLSNNTSSLSLHDQINQLVINYQIDMNNNFTIYQIAESINCDYVYKWTVNKDEYFNWLPTFGGSGKGIIKQKPKDSGGAAMPGDNSTIIPTDEYSNCF